MTSSRPQSGSHRPRLVLCLLAGLLACVFAGINASGASALTTAANCALPGSTFQGGDGKRAKKHSDPAQAVSRWMSAAGNNRRDAVSKTSAETEQKFTRRPGG